jgi:hypothetical protein
VRTSTTKCDDEKETTTLDALRETIRMGLDSGAGKPAEEVLTCLERKYGDGAGAACPVTNVLLVSEAETYLDRNDIVVNS